MTIATATTTIGPRSQEVLNKHLLNEMKCLCEGTLRYKSRNFLISVICVIFPLRDLEQDIFLWGN